VKANAAVEAVLQKETASIPRLGLSIAAQQAVADLAFHVSTFMNNDLRGQRQSMQRSGLPSRSITSRLKGKEGRIRGSLMGKRVDFSARSVVSPDSQMDIDQVGVPYRVAMKLTVPERATDWNLERLRAAVLRGPHKLMGAFSVTKGKETILLEFADLEREAKILKPGNVVARFLGDDDVVLFNRQPSLHKGSMMAYRVRLMPHKTFRLNMAVTLPLNADCDGDELNVHVPQDEESRVEARLIMAVPEQIVSPQANKPCIGFVQDAVVGSWLLTREQSVSRRTAMYLRASVRHSQKPLPPQQSYAARPRTRRAHGPRDLQPALPARPPVAARPRPRRYRNDKTGVLVRDGALLRGTLCKVTLGATSGGLVHCLYLSHGPRRTAEFLSDAQRLVGRWLTQRGFSIRLSDCQPSADTKDAVAATIRLAEQKIARILSADAVACLSEDRIEAALSEIANKVLTNVGKVVHASLDENHNALYQAVLCASKGNLINIAQLIGCIGQTSVEGRRIFVDDAQQQFGEPGSMAKSGFVARSYYQGLTHSEFFYHTMAGREGLIDTAVKTANTGYLQRRLMKAMETVTVAYDRTVRNARQNIVQFAYGADSYDATFLVRQSLPCFQEPLAQLAQRFQPEEWEPFRAALVLVRKQRVGHADVGDVVYAPGSVRDVLFVYGELPGELPLAQAVRGVQELCDACCSAPWARRSAYEALLRWHLRYEEVRRLHPRAFEAVLAEMRRRTLLAQVAPGEAVGALAAQSISEPLTQLTLNTFHMAGVKSKNVTLGVPRIKELRRRLASRRPST
jgi:DNA-directed RNA polymerase II subunit RPB1